MLGHWKTGVFIGLFAGGCVQSPQSMFGDTAVYSSAHNGYIVVPLERTAEVQRGLAKAGDDFVLRNPNSGEKLRCEDEVKRWAPIHARVMANEAYDRSWERASEVILFPFSAVGYALTGLGLALVYIPLAPAAIGAPADAEIMVQNGLTAWAAARDDESIDWYEKALVQSPTTRRDTHVLYFLGRAYESADRTDAAMDAYRAFLVEAEVANPAAYADANRRLIRGGDPAPPPCASQAPVPMHYPNVGEVR